MDQDKPRPKPPNAGIGRKKGCLNKTTAAVKDAILHAFDELGGKSYLVHVGESDPRTFCALLAKILPQEMRAEVSVDQGLADLLAKARARAKADS